MQTHAGCLPRCKLVAACAEPFQLSMLTVRYCLPFNIQHTAGTHLWDGSIQAWPSGQQVYAR